MPTCVGMTNWARPVRYLLRQLLGVALVPTQHPAHDSGQATMSATITSQRQAVAD
jgi:hypothetical protein